MRGEAQGLRILQEPAPARPLVGDHDWLERVEQQLVGHAAEGGEGALEPMYQDLHRLPRIERHPQESRVPEDHKEGLAHTPRNAELGEIDLRLVPGRGRDAHHGLRYEAWPRAAYIIPQLRVAARATRGPALGQEAHGRERGEGAEPRVDDRREGIESTRHALSRPRWPGRSQIALQRPGAEDVIDQTATDARLAGDGGLREALLKEMAE